MKNIDELLQELSQQTVSHERKEMPLTEAEVQRIHQRTLQKINREANTENTAAKTIKHPTFWRKYCKPLAAAAAACLVCMVGVTTFAAFGYDSSIKNFFRIYDNKSQKAAEQLADNVDATDSCNGIRLKVSQTIGDRSGFYVVFDASGVSDSDHEWAFQDSGLQITGKDGTHYDYTTNDMQNGYIDEHNTKFSLLVSGVNSNGEDIDINGSHIDLTLKNLGYRNGHGKFITTNKGSWKLKWKFQTKAKPEQLTVNKEITLLDSKAVWNDIVLSPISITTHYTITQPGKAHLSQKEWEKCEKSERIIIQFTDGSRIDSRYEDDITTSQGTDTKPGYTRLGFDQIIDAKKIASITFGNETVTLRKGKKGIDRVRLTSKAAKCYVSLPESVAQLITIKEKKNIQNKDLHRRETTATFIAKRGGATMPFFTIHRLQGRISEQKLETDSPLMVYIGYHAGHTYTIEYSELQTEAQSREFTDILNKYIANILPFFEYID